MGSEQFKLTLEQIDYAVSAADIKRLDGGDWGRKIIGQPRALEALEMGTSIRAKGYNVFVNGAAGTGRKADDLSLVAGYVVSDWQPDFKRCELSFACVSSFAIDTQIVTAIGGFVFEQLGAYRVFARTSVTSFT